VTAEQSNGMSAKISISCLVEYKAKEKKREREGKGRRSTSEND
jgi:hypothetical protein